MLATVEPEHNAAVAEDVAAGQTSWRFADAFADAAVVLAVKEWHMVYERREEDLLGWYRW